MEAGIVMVEVGASTVIGNVVVVLVTVSVVVVDDSTMVEVDVTVKLVVST